MCLSIIRYIFTTFKVYKVFKVYQIDVILR